MTVASHLRALRTRSDQLVHLIGGLTNGQWERSTNCPPWLVRDLAVHVVTSGRGHAASVERGLDGLTDPPPRTDLDFSGADPPIVASALAHVTDDFEALYDGLSQAQLETICWHRRGNRSVRWYAAHRLAEVAFHGWDLETSLDRSPAFDNDLAKLLLPTLLESNVPRTYAAGLSAERGRGERYLLRVADEPSLTWLVTINREALDARRVGPTERHEDIPRPVQGELAVTASAGDLALLVYGRASLETFEDVVGEQVLVERFARIFPRP